MRELFRIKRETPTHTQKKKRKKKYLSRLRRDNRKGPPHIKVDRSTSSNNARDFDDFDFDAEEEEEEEEETRRKKKRDRSVFLSFQKRGDQSRSFLLLRGGFFAPFLNTPPKQPPGEREYLLR